MKIRYESSFLRIWHDAEHQVLELEWLDFATSTQLQHGLLLGLQLARELDVKAWTGNLQQMHVIRPCDQEWISREWWPRFAALGLQRLAILESEDPLNRMGVTQLMRINAHLTPHATAYFTSLLAARRWAQAWPEELLAPLMARPVARPRQAAP